MFALPRTMRRCGLDSKSSRLSAGDLVFDDLPYCSGGTEWSSTLSASYVFIAKHICRYENEFVVVLRSAAAALQLRSLP